MLNLLHLHERVPLVNTAGDRRLAHTDFIPTLMRLQV